MTILKYQRDNKALKDYHEMNSNIKLLYNNYYLKNFQPKNNKDRRLGRRERGRGEEKGERGNKNKKRGKEKKGEKSEGGKCTSCYGLKWVFLKCIY